jgi:antitoxin HicB
LPPQPATRQKVDAMATASREEIERVAAQYSILLRWSPEDNAYLVYLPEWAYEESIPGTYGATREKAVKNAQVVLEMMVRTDLKDGETLPKPDVVTYEDEDSDVES